MRLWGGLSVEILADLIQELPHHFLFIFLIYFETMTTKNKISVRPLYRQTSSTDHFACLLLAFPR